MKKVYALMAFASALTATATVQPTNLIPATMSNELQSASALEYKLVEKTDGMLKAPATPQFDGQYWGFLYRGFTDKDKEQQQSVIQITPTGGNNVEIFGLFCPVIASSVKGTYDASTMSITIPSGQVLATAEETGLEEDLMFWAKTLVPDADNMVSPATAVDAQNVVLRYAPEGVQYEDGTIGLVGGWVFENYLSLMVFNQASAKDGQKGFVGSWKWNNRVCALEDVYPEAPAFVFNENEWTEIGESTITDEWFGLLLNDNKPYSVKTYVNKADENIYVLANPYATGTPLASINSTPDAKGYIVLDITNPDCVLVRPNVPSGMSLPDFGLYGNVPITTLEGVDHYINEMDVEDIIAAAEKFDDPLPVMSSTRLITLPNCRFQLLNEMDEPDQWSQNKEPVPMVTTIQLANPAGVNDILDNSENAPKRFFNLQGVEVSNPEAGQLVIVKQGNKSYKTIAK